MFSINDDDGVVLSGISDVEFVIELIIVDKLVLV